MTPTQSMTNILSHLRYAIKNLGLCIAPKITSFVKFPGANWFCNSWQLFIVFYLDMSITVTLSGLVENAHMMLQKYAVSQGLQWSN